MVSEHMSQKCHFGLNIH